MLFKSLLVGTVLAGLTGGVVYFGTGGELSDVKLDKAMAEVKADTKTVTKTVTTTVKETIDDLTGKTTRTEEVVEEIIEGDEDTISEDSVIQDKPNSEQKKWLDQYLKKQKKQAVEADESEREEIVPEKGDVSDESAEIIEVFKAETQDTQDEAVEIEDVKEIIREGGADKATAKLIIKDKKEGKIDNKRPKKKTPSLADLKKNEVRSVYQTVLKETEAIEIIELKDRAYLSLIDYMIRNAQFGRAQDVIEKISQPELRDTARSNIAVGYARTGKRSAAFKVLEGVETEALSDVLRLQVIEAMTAPSSVIP